MKAFRQVAMAAVFMVFAASAMIVSAQGPLQKRVNFSINTPFEIGKSNAVLPAGDYILLQVYTTNPNVFALYRNSLTHEPIAMIQTIRIDYGPLRYPQKTRMLLKNDEEADMDVPIISGWTIPGMDGWEILQTVISRDRATMAYLPKYHRMKGQVHVTATASGY